ncbi:hypothetical protein FA95DRAFT_1571880 [Auriscalpium vulgare]|uniref:Uncharacterized protein n=1 Tax=Auriscalpium vulgare TaxID=40419 RepID=A0ACB8RXZ6_9AGAM|nr:hypothetical protein FA95DRAFT_1571880 [Auriscalpium vulgare]
MKFSPAFFALVLATVVSAMPVTDKTDTFTGTGYKRGDGTDTFTGTGYKRGDGTDTFTGTGYSTCTEHSFPLTHSALQTIPNRAAHEVFGTSNRRAHQQPVHPRHADGHRSELQEHPPLPAQPSDDEVHLFTCYWAVASKPWTATEHSFCGDWRQNWHWSVQT